jgi:hypothetical protein
MPATVNRILQPERTFWLQFWERMNGEEGAAYGLSVVVHILLIALLAIPVFRAVQEREEFTTIVQAATDEQVVIDPSFDTEVALANPIETAAGGNELQTNLLDTMNSAAMSLPEINPGDLPSLPGKEGKPGFGGEGTSGIRIAEPRNAVRAGNFSVWPWPITGSDVRGQIAHGLPGEAPKVFQDYHIVIRLRVPKGRRTVNLSDFSGEVVGTDQYYQKIPQDAWFFNASGDLIRARTGRSLPVIDGTAELLIRVPGASTPAIQDSITVYSRLLDEEQKIQLTFRDR